MIDDTWLAEQFEAHRARLKSVAYRILGSDLEAEDMVQETWLRLSRACTEDVENLSGWLTTAVARAALDRLRARRSRREESLEESTLEAEPVERQSPEDEIVLADSMGPALLVVLERLAPAERVAFVLFGLSFEEIAPIVERTPTATRKLASRARQRVRGPLEAPKAALGLQRKIVSAFLAASRAGDFGALLELLDPKVVVRADTVAVSAARQAQGAPKLAPAARRIGCSTASELNPSKHGRRSCCGGRAAARAGVSFRTDDVESGGAVLRSFSMIRPATRWSCSSLGAERSSPGGPDEQTSARRARWSSLGNEQRKGAMTIAFWCVLVGVLLPYVAFGIARNRGRGPDGKRLRDNRNPRDFPYRIGGLPKRAWDAQLNAFESLPGFAAAVIIAHLAHAPQNQIDILASAWVLVRVAHLAFYLTDKDKLRTSAQIISFACVLGLFVVAGWS